MKILGICASLREDSNTNKIVKKIVEASGCDYELVYLKDLEIKPCTGCYNCMMTEGQCSQMDGMQSLYEKMMNAGAMVFGAPTYFLDVSGVAKCFIDRTMAIFYRGVGENAEIEVLGKRPLAGRPAVPVTTVAGNGHLRAIETIKTYFQVNKMKIVDEIAEPVGMGDVSDMPEVMQKAEKAGKKLGEILRKK